MKKHIYVLALSFIGATAGMWMYHTYFNPVKKIYIEQEKKAVRTAEQEILHSDRYNLSLRTSAPTDFIDAAGLSREAVVSIRSLKAVNDPSYNNTFNASNGSGVIIASDGYIVTNNHVIEGSDQIEVVLNNKKEYTAELVGRDPSTDLALLKIEVRDIPFLSFGNSDSLSVGEWVIAIGNPFRLQSTVTAGIVSAKGRNINILENFGIESFIQTDAAVNPGNSGGALVNTHGELIGINAAIMTYSGKYEGFSFAIPSNLAKKIVIDLKEHGSVQRGWLGVSIIELNSSTADRLGLKEVQGVYLNGLTDEGSAEEAGLKRGDVMLEVNNFPTPTVPAFMEQIARYRPGDVVKITFIRGGVKQIIEAVLKNQNNTTDFISIRRDKVLKDLGIELRELDSTEKSKLGKGVYVVSVEVNSLIGKTNMDPGYILQTINGKEVENVNALVAILKTLKGKVIVEGFYENYPGEYPYSFEME